MHYSIRYTYTDSITIVFPIDYDMYKWLARGRNIIHTYNVCTIFQRCLSVDQAEKSASSMYPSFLCQVFWLWMWTLVCKYLVCILYKLSTLLTHPCVQRKIYFSIILSIPVGVWSTIGDAIVPLYDIYKPIEDDVAFGAVYSLECSGESLGKCNHIWVVVWRLRW